MKQQLHLKSSLSLALTPHMRQGLDMLQLNNIELQQLLMPLLAKNPFLIKEDLAEDDLPIADNDVLEMSWDDYTYAAYHDDEDQMMNVADPYPDDPKHSLLWQLNAHIFSDKDIMIAMAIIDSLDEHGYLTSTNEELYMVLMEYIPFLTKNQLEIVRHKIMDIEPYGIASRNLQEFLAYQIIKSCPHSSISNLAIELIDNQINAIAHFDLKQLMMQTKRSKEDILAAIALIRQLRARPWACEHDKQPVVPPDLLLITHNDKLQVNLNYRTLPKIHFDNYYYNAIANRIEDQQFFLAAFKEAHDIIGNLSKRNKTLLHIAQVIVDYQTEYLTNTNQLKPLDMAYLSKYTGLHVSTISRAIKNKTIATIHGLLPLKKLLSLAVHSQTDVSTTSIQEKIQTLITQENKHKPLSDQAIVDRLKIDFQLDVARRTVAKYRTQAGILPASLRRQHG
ncbi:MAG: RNA polymerase factor sigma-54 [Gammaproteobacteria bacterium]